MHDSHKILIAALRTLVPVSVDARARVLKRRSASAWLDATWRPSRLTAASRTLMASSCSPGARRSCHLHRDLLAALKAA